MNHAHPTIRLSILRILLPALLLCPVPGNAVEDDLLGLAGEKAPTQPNAADRDAAAAGARRALAQGAALSREGMDHIRRFNQDQTRNATAIVDAAIAFGRAHALLTTAGADSDLMAEVQANLYWCRKQMDMDAIKDYVAKKGDDYLVAAKQMDVVMAVNPDPAQAGEYFARAERSAKANAYDFIQIAIRFTEVAERFPGTAQGTEANKRAAAAVQAQMRALQENQVTTRQTRFTKPKAVIPGATALPSAQDQKDGLAQVRKFYAKDFAKRSNPAKVRLARKLLEETGKNRSDPVVFHQLVSEAIRLASEAESYEVLFEGVELLVSTFAGLDAMTEKQAVLKRLSSKPVAAAIARLLVEPADPPSNLIAGKWFSFVAHRWSEGLPMLAMGADPDIARVAGMEMGASRAEGEALQLADAWYDASAKQRSKDDKVPLLARAMYWYQQAIPQLSGLAKERVVKRVTDIDKLVPLDLDNVDWGALTASQWEKIKGRTVTIQARVDRFDPGISLAASDVFRVVPHPTEEWNLVLENWSTEGKKTSCDWRGYRSDREHFFERAAFNLGALLVWIENNEKQNAGIIKGPGRVYFSPYISGWSMGDRSGSIRVKLVPMGEDE